MPCFQKSNQTARTKGNILETIDQATSNGDNVLESSTQLDTDDILDNVDSEGRGVEDVTEKLTVGAVAVANSGLAEFFLGDLIGNVGARQDTGANAE